jgi:hypothetical protein
MNRWPGPVRPGVRHELSGRRRRERTGRAWDSAGPGVWRHVGVAEALSLRGLSPGSGPPGVWPSPARRRLWRLWGAGFALLAAGDRRAAAPGTKEAPNPQGLRASVGRCAPRPSPPRTGPLPAAGTWLVEASANLALACREALPIPPPAVRSPPERVPSPGWAGRGIGGTDHTAVLHGSLSAPQRPPLVVRRMSWCIFDQLDAMLMPSAERSGPPIARKSESARRHRRSMAAADVTVARSVTGWPASVATALGIGRPRRRVRRRAGRARAACVATWWR